MTEGTVRFPCDVEQWTGVKTKLLLMASESHTLSPRLLVSKLADVHRLLPAATPPRAGAARAAAARSKNVFSGLDTFLEEAYTDAEREIFFCRVLPYVIRKAVEVESLRPSAGLRIAGNTPSSVALGRNLVACMLACSVLCLWPEQRSTRGAHHPLTAANFSAFYSHCGKPSQCAKLKCILHYFETLSVLYRAPTGSLVFHRQVLSEVPLLSDWLSCDDALCHMTVFSTGCIEDSGPNVLQVDFANRRLGGGVLTAGAVQEEIRFSTCPELIAGMLFQSAMADNEAILVQGFENFSYYKGYARTFRYAGPYHDPAQEDEQGNLQNYLCAIDALPLRGSLAPEDQYRVELVLRELNKAYAGFNQDCLQLQHSLPPAHTPEQAAVSAMSTVVEKYFATLSEDILTTALQHTLIPRHDDSTSSSTHSQAGGCVGAELAPDCERRRTSNSSDISRRSSDLSDLSRRSSDLSDCSRRSSDSSGRSTDWSRRSSTSGSRRSSCSQHGAEAGAQVHEYFTTFQARHMVKSSTIEEEATEQQQDAATLRRASPPPPLPLSTLPPLPAPHSAPQIVRPKVNTSLSHSAHNLVEPKVINQDRKQTSGGISDPVAKPLFVAPSHERCDKVDMVNATFKDSTRKELRKLKQTESKPASVSKPHSSIDPRSQSLNPEILAQQILAATFSQVSTKSRKHNKKKENYLKEKNIVQNVEHGKDKERRFKPVVVDIEPESDSSEGAHSRNHRLASSGVKPLSAVPVEHQTDRHVSSAEHETGRHMSAVEETVAERLVEEAMAVALQHVSQHYTGERRGGDSRWRREERLQGFAHGLVQNVWTHSRYNVKKHLEHSQHQQQTWTSDSHLDLDLDVYMYADEFVSSVLDEAVEAVKAEKREEQERLEAMWRRAQERFELDAMYFNAEFSRFSNSDKKPKAGCRFVRSVVEQDLIRRRSLDDFKYSQGSRQNGYHHLTPGGDNRTFLESGRKSPMLLIVGGRRASEPITRRRGSSEAQSLMSRHERRRRSSGSTSTSRELILDWFDGNRRSRTDQSRRFRTTSCHLDWFAQDLLLEAFNDALKDLFGDPLCEHTESMNPSSASSHSADLCDISLAIPDTALSLPKHSNQYSSTTSSDIDIRGASPQLTHMSNKTQSKRCSKLSPTRISKSDSLCKSESVYTEKTSRFSCEGATPETSELTVPQPSAVAPFAHHMIDGLCDNLSNSVIEGTVKTLIQGPVVNEPNRANAVQSQPTDNSSSQVTSMPMTGATASQASQSLVHGAKPIRTNVPKDGSACGTLDSEDVPGNQGSELEDRKTEQEARPTGQCLPIATGNWGCGAYAGDPQLKALIQWLAASRLRTPTLYYYTFAHPQLHQLGEMCRQLEERETRVGQLTQLLLQYCQHRRQARPGKAKSLLDFIQQAAYP